MHVMESVMHLMQPSECGSENVNIHPYFQGRIVGNWLTENKLLLLPMSQGSAVS